MSGFGGGTAFQIYTEGDENVQPGIRKTKRDDQGIKPPATKRAALGVISNSTSNSQRVQPVRAAKQVQPQSGFEAFGGCENIQAKNPFQTSVAPVNFSIHVDESSASQPASILPGPVLTGVQPLKPSLVSLANAIAIDVDESPVSANADSPMLLETSVVDATSKVQESADERLRRVLLVPEYTDDIYEYIRQSELRFRPKPNYMKKQPDINSNMRNILVDWLVEVAEEYRLHRETLMLAVSYIDRFLSGMSVLRGKLQLVGAAAMFLAAKYEEIYPPEVGEFVYITDDTYTKKQVLKMEHLILKVLSFDVAAPTINLFAERFLHQMGHTEDDQAYHLTMMLSELSLIDSETYLQFLPSTIAASCVVVANHTLGLTPWPQHMVSQTGYGMHDLTPCVSALCQTFSASVTHPQQAVRDKYKNSKLKEVANIPAPLFPPAGCSPQLPPV